jgi:hypothetical protein
VAVIALLAVAAVHAAAIPDGKTWWCTGAGCEREEITCGAVSGVPGAKCASLASVWVATAQDRRTGHWKRVARSTEDACKAVVATSFKHDRSVSACVAVAATDPVPPERSLVPKGKGWVCYSNGLNDLGSQMGISSPSRCFRSERECHYMHYGTGGAVITTLDDTGCTPQKTAWVMTTNDGYEAAESQADCEKERKGAEDRTACAELK